MATIRINEGNSYIVSSTYTDPEHGWEVFRIADDGKKNELACFVNERFRPTGLTPGDKVAIKKITGLTLGWKKKKVYSKQENAYVEKWMQEFSATVDAVKVASEVDDGSLDWVDEIENTPLPWSDGDLPL